ncbi:MAG: DUF935 family protein [Chitinophagales bacterium]|nr:DUF935 family protein [Chitinophagales bacterium]
MEKNKSYSTMAMLNNQAERDAEGKKQPVIIQQITVRPPIIRSLDIEAWRNAMRHAKAAIPRRTELYDLYEDILLDGHLSSVVEKRLMSVTNIEWEFVDANGNPVKHINDWIDTPDFEKVVCEILNSKIWGYTMLEFDFYSESSWGVFLIPRKHMRPKQGVVAFEQTAHAGINIREGEYADTVLEAGDPDNLGLLLKAAPYVIYKRGNFGDWAQFIERFGQPLIDAIWDGYDESQRLMLLEALDKMGSGGQIVRPAGTQLQFMQGGTNNPTGQLNDLFKDACNAEISKLFLGQTETTESSSSSGYAQASIHADTETDINVADRNFVRRILNRRLIKMLQANGIETGNGFFRIKSNKDDLAEKKARLDIDLALLNNVRLPISDDYFYQTYGIEKPADYEEQKRRLEQQQAAQLAPGMGLTMQQLIQLRDEGFFG